MRDGTLIKDKNNHILFFFSLRCGLLYDEFVEGEQLRSLNLLYAKLAENLSDVHLSEVKRKQVSLLMEGLRSKKGIQRQTVTDVLRSNHIDIDINKLFSKHQLSVGKSFSGVELMHFCANDEYHDSWLLKDVKPLGSVVFWQFVVPIVLDIIKLVGCEYLFLFAADLTEDELLVRYYNDYLGFTEKTEHHVAMPLYDLACKFMYQDTKDLMNRRNVFFDNFNPDEDAV